MKRKMKVILSGIIVLAVIFATTVFATVGSRNAELWYNNIKIMLNGKEVVPTDANGNSVEPFIIDGTTYLPVRGVASALGLEVGCDASTNTVTLNNPGVFSWGVQVYEDEYVTIDFVGCRKTDIYGLVNYYADFNVTNRTDVTLTFQPESLSLNGISYKVVGSEEVAPQSTGKISFTAVSDVVLPTEGISKTSGQISVIDFDKMSTDYFSNYAYDVKWVNVTQQ